MKNKNRENYALQSNIRARVLQFFKLLKLFILNFKKKSMAGKRGLFTHVLLACFELKALHCKTLSLFCDLQF